jgi:hypothetical protein
MRQTILVLATMGLAVLLASGLALAAPKKGTTPPPNPTAPIYCKEGTSCQGTGGPDIIIGTPSADVIIPYDGNDKVYAGSGNDEVRHSFGDDLIKGGPGNDTLRGGRGTDTIYGGVGKDLIDCAWLAMRATDKEDFAWFIKAGTGYPSEEVDTVVDCKTKYEPDPTYYGDESDPTYPYWTN